MLSYFKSVGKLGSTDGETVSTLCWDTRCVRTNTCFKCILNLEFWESCDLFVNFKYNVHKCEVQCNAFTVV